MRFSLAILSIAATYASASGPSEEDKWIKTNLDLHARLLKAKGKVSIYKNAVKNEAKSNRKVKKELSAIVKKGHLSKATFEKMQTVLREMGVKDDKLYAVANND